MRIKSKGLVAVLLCAVMVMALALAGCGSDDTKKDDSSDTGSYQLVKAGKLTVGSDCDYPPFIQLDANGKPEGFEYDLMSAIAKEMGLEVEYTTPQAFDTIIPQIVAGGKMDVGVSSFTITPERKEEVDFSDPYFKDGVNQAITVPKDSAIKTEADFNGKKVGVQAGTTGGQWAEENLKGAEVVPFTNITDAFNAMMAGKVDGCVNDLPAAEGLINKTFTDIVVLKSVPTAEEYGIVVSKDNPDLKDAINKALSKLQSDGTIDEITSKWIDQQ